MIFWMGNQHTGVKSGIRAAVQMWVWEAKLGWNIWEVFLIRKVLRFSGNTFWPVFFQMQLWLWWQLLLLLHDTLVQCFSTFFATWHTDKGLTWVVAPLTGRTFRLQNQKSHDVSGCLDVGGEMEAVCPWWCCGGRNLTAQLHSTSCHWPVTHWCNTLVDLSLQSSWPRRMLG